MDKEGILKTVKAISDNLEMPEPTPVKIDKPVPSHWVANPMGHVWLKTKDGSFIPECLSCGFIYCDGYDVLTPCPNDELCQYDRGTYRYDYRAKCPKCGGDVSRRITSVGPTGAAGGSPDGVHRVYGLGKFICMNCKTQFTREEETTTARIDGVTLYLSENIIISGWRDLVLLEKYHTEEGFSQEAYRHKNGEYRTG